MTASFTESVVEQATLEWFASLGYSILSGPTLAPGEPASERTSFEQPFLEGRLRDALARLNPSLPTDALEEAFRKLTRISSPQLRVIVKRILRKYGYPPDKQEAATSTVLQQAELLSEYWAPVSARS